MKKLLLAVVTVFAVSMLAPCPGFTEPTHPNEIGLYLTPDGYGATGTNDIGIPINVFLVLTRPEANNVPLSGITLFECQLNFNPIGGIFLTGSALNGNGINIGDIDHIENGYLEYIVGFAQEVPAINDAVLLVTLQLLNALQPGPVEVTLGATSAPYIPDQMGFVTPFQTFEIMYPVSGHPDAPVFMFNGLAVPVENESFGSVKALYR